MFLTDIEKELEAPVAAPVKNPLIEIPYCPSEFPEGNIPLTFIVFVPEVYTQAKVAVEKTDVHEEFEELKEKSAGVVGKVISK